MAKRLDEQEIAVARVYARALLGLAEQAEQAVQPEKGGGAERILAELEQLGQAAESQAELAQFIAYPLVETNLRSAALERVFRGKASDLLVDTLQVMNRKGRLALLPALAQAYRQELEDRRGRVEVEVSTPVALTDASRERLRKAISSHTGREADLIEIVDENLIGGMILRVGDRKIDTSVSKELRRLGDRLLERASAEIQAGKAYFADADSAE